MEQWQSRERYKEGLRTFRADTSHLLICLKLESIATSLFFSRVGTPPKARTSPKVIIKPTAKPP